MIRNLLHFFINRFEARYDYDATYLHTINDISPGAAMKLLKISGLTGYQGPEPAVWGGAALSATLLCDCGPCAQLVLDLVQEAGVDQEELRACVNGDWEAAGATGLGFRFARAIHTNGTEVDALSAQIVNRFGKKALVAASYAATSYQIYPLLKRALGEAKSCEILLFRDNTSISMISP